MEREIGHGREKDGFLSTEESPQIMMRLFLAQLPAHFAL